MKGGNVTFILEDGTIIKEGGSLDIKHIFALREKIEQDTGKKVIEHEASWKK